MVHPARGSKTATETARDGRAAAAARSNIRRGRLARLLFGLVLAGLLVALPAASAPSTLTPVSGSGVREAAVVGAPAALIRAPAAAAPEILAKRPKRKAQSGRAKVGLFTASPATLSAAGGTVHLLAMVQRARTCQFISSKALKPLPATERCSSGRVSIKVRLPRNTTSSDRSYHFELVASGARGATRTAPVTVVEHALHTAGAVPVITTQPTSRDAVAGASVTFSADATGAATVRWELSTDAGRSWSDIAGADARSYTFVAVSADSGYEYRATFSSGERSATTSAATLTVSGTAGPPATQQPGGQNVSSGPGGVAPAITQEPSGQGVLAENQVSFTAAASGVPAPSVQWQVSTDAGSSWANVAGATSATYSVAAPLNQGGDLYRAVFTNSAGSAVTNPALLDVASSDTGPSVISGPTDESTVSGQSVSFSAIAMGVPWPSVQWQILEGDTWANLAGDNATTYSFTPTLSDSGEEFRAEFHNAAGTVDTGAVTLSVLSAAVAPTVTLDPTDENVFEGSVATFVAGASGTPTPTIQWQQLPPGGNWTDVPVNGGSPSYSITTSLAENGYEYRAVFTNSAGSASSDPATLSVTEPPSPPSVTTQPANGAAVSGGSVTFSAAATGYPAPAVQWQMSTDGGSTWGDVAGQTSGSYTLNGATQGENGWQFRAVFTNTSGSVTSNAATLTVGSDSGSPNWSGYEATGATFSSVSGSWTVPPATCTPGVTSYSATWVGIDGYRSDDNTVEQDGTDSDCTGSGARYYAWYEMYGDVAINGGYAMPLPDTVSAGDAMTASVSVTGSSWTLVISDTSGPQPWSKTIPITWQGPLEQSAEWIVERPDVCSPQCTPSSLTDFSTVSFTDAMANGEPISSYANQPVQMTSANDTALLALPGALAGSAFSDTWYGSS
jgi:hypothetical protein